MKITDKEILSDVKTFSAAYLNDGKRYDIIFQEYMDMNTNHRKTILNYVGRFGLKVSKDDNIWNDIKKALEGK